MSPHRSDQNCNEIVKEYIKLSNKLKKELLYIAKLKNSMNSLKNKLTIDFILNNQSSPLFITASYLNDDHFWKPLDKDVRSIIFDYLKDNVSYSHIYCRTRQTTLKIKSEENDYITGIDKFGNTHISYNYVKYNH
jgi:hypothetical protein